MKKSVNVYQTNGLTMIVNSSNKYWYIEIISFNLRCHRSYKVEKYFNGSPRFNSEDHLISSFLELGVIGGTKTCFEMVEDFNIENKYIVETSEHRTDNSLVTITYNMKREPIGLQAAEL